MTSNDLMVSMAYGSLDSKVNAGNATGGVFAYSDFEMFALPSQI